MCASVCAAIHIHMHMNRGVCERECLCASGLWGNGNYLKSICSTMGVQPQQMCVCLLISDISALSNPV